MFVLKILLLPFAFLYQVITNIRNYLYDKGYRKSQQFDLAVISVGNLNVGGSGKTPMVEYLVRLLSDHYSIAILSRGYGRNTKGFRVASSSDNAFSIGDEPYQYFRKWNTKLTVAVGEKRSPAIATILNRNPATEVILLDDAFQHRPVTPSFSILLSDYSKPFYNDLLLPAGRLRESRSGAKRANVVIITKCPDEVGEQEFHSMTMKTQKYAGRNTPVYFTKITYKNPEGFTRSHTIQKKIVLVSGIANSLPLERYLASQYDVVRHFKFDDHHSYTLDEIGAIQKAASEQDNTCILTTEKDMVKLISQEFNTALNKEKWFYLPVETTFIKNGSDFDTLLKSKLKPVAQN